MALKKLVVVVGANFDEFSAKVKQFEKDLKKIEKQFSGFEKIGKRLERAGKSLTVGLTLPIVGLGVAAAKAAGNFEQIQIAFETMLGSGEKAAELLKNLEALAFRTSFQFTDLAEAAKRMLALGFSAEQTVPILTIIGDAVAGLGGSKDILDRIVLAFAQMQAKGAVMTQEMRQLAEAGIPAWELLAEKLGVDVPTAMEMVEKRMISASAAIPAILAGMNEKFSGLMEKQSQTMLGKLNQLKNQLYFTLRDLGEILLPTIIVILDALKPILVQIGELAKRFAALPAPIKNTAIAILALTAILGPMLVGIGKLIAVIPKLISGFTAVKAGVLAASVPIALVMANLEIWGGVIRGYSAEWEYMGVNFKLLFLNLERAFLKFVRKIIEIDLYIRDRKLFSWLPGMQEVIKTERSWVKSISDSIDDLTDREAELGFEVAKIEAAMQAKSVTGVKSPVSTIAVTADEIKKLFANSLNSIEDINVESLKFATNMDHAAETVDAFAKVPNLLKEAADYLDERTQGEKLRDALIEAQKQIQEQIITLEFYGDIGRHQSKLQQLYTNLADINTALEQVTSSLETRIVRIRGVEDRTMGVVTVLKEANEWMNNINNRWAEMLKTINNVINAFKRSFDFEFVKAALKDLGLNLKDALLRKMPILNDVLAGILAGAPGGGFAMITGGINALIQHSQTFAGLLNIINPILQALADAVGSLLKPLLPLFQIISMTLVPIFSVMGTILGALLLPVMKALFPIFKFLGLVVVTVAIVIAKVWNALIRIIDKIPFVNMSGWYINIGELEDAQDALTDATWDSVEAMGAAADAAQDLAKEFNVVRGFKRAEYEYTAAIPAFQSGGIMPYTGLALLHAGERVLTPEQQNGGNHYHFYGDVYGFEDFKRKIRQANAENKITFNRARLGIAGVTS